MELIIEIWNSYFAPIMPYLLLCVILGLMIYVTGIGTDHIDHHCDC